MSRIISPSQPAAFATALSFDGPAIRRLVSALTLEQKDEYAIQTRYMSAESMDTVSQNPAIGLLAALALA
jgi:hypothetical protein